MTESKCKCNAAVCLSQPACRQARAAKDKFTVISPPSWQSHTVTVPCQSVAVWAVGRAVCAQWSGCLVAAASLYQLQTLTRPTCPHYNTQVNTICLQSSANGAFPRHRGIPLHLRKFRGAACYSAACRKLWALLTINIRGYLQLLQSKSARTEDSFVELIYCSVSGDNTTRIATCALSTSLSRLFAPCTLQETCRYSQSSTTCPDTSRPYWSPTPSLPWRWSLRHTSPAHQEHRAHECRALVEPSQMTQQH